MPTQIPHGTDLDKNIIVQVEYDKGGRTTAMRHPDGRQDVMRYDLLNRRTTHVRGYVPQATDPDQWQWVAGNSQWEDGAGVAINHGSNDRNLVTRTTHQRSGPLTGGTQTILTDPNGFDTARNFDALGRLAQIDYGDPAVNNTANVGFEYDLAGNRTAMNEYSDDLMTALQRRTGFSYDAARRLSAVAVDADGNGTDDHTVSYAYDRGGQRTTMTVDDGGTPLSISYQYDERGQLVGLTDWDSQATGFEYDGAGRHTATRRVNNLDSTYKYDRASRLKELRHQTANTVFGSFRYTVDKRGNRVRAVESLRTGSGNVTTQYNDPSVEQFGSWTGDTTNDPKAIVRIPFASDQIEVRIGEGPNYSMLDIYVDGVFWGTVDGYNTTPGDRDISITLNQPGPHELELRNRSRHSLQARTAVGFNPANYTLRFVSLTENGEYDVNDIQYVYDALSRLQTANYNDGETAYNYSFDVAGNLVNNNGVARTYNAVNQLIHDGANTLTYDRNGNLTSDGVNAYVWDRANRMLSMGGHSYAYDGDGRRLSQTVSSVVTEYLLDTQPALAQVITTTTGANTQRYVHGPRGIHAMEDSVGTWSYAAQDGLGSVRSEIDTALNLLQTHTYTPIGAYIGMPPSDPYFGFTGEQTDLNHLIYLRNRYYNPDIGVFPSMDPFEGTMDRAMSLNGYMYVEGDPISRTDPSGRCYFNLQSTGSQVEQCYDVFRDYEDIVRELYPSWPDDIALLVAQERVYWGNLTYTEFVNQWNGSRSPASTTSNGAGDIARGTFGASVTMSMVNPGPGPEDVGAGMILVGGLCVAALAAVGIAVGGGTIALPQRQPIDFSIPDIDDDAIPIPLDRAIPRDRPDDRSCQTVYRGERSSMTPIVVFSSGFLPKGDNGDLIQHTRTNGAGSIYISTSRLQSIAFGFAGRNGYVYRICTSRGIDVNLTLGEESWYPEQQEIAIPYIVFPYEVEGAYPKSGGEYTGIYLPNPNFR